MAVPALDQEFGQMNISDQGEIIFQEAREIFKLKINAMSTDVIQEGHTQILTESLSNVEFAQDMTNKDKFKALQQHRRLTNISLQVSMNIGATVQVQLTPSEQWQSFARKQVNAHLSGDNPLPDFDSVIKTLEKYIQEHGGNQKRLEIAKAMLAAIYGTNGQQPLFQDVFNAGSDSENRAAIKAAQYFILITQINVAVPMLPSNVSGSVAGRTSGIDAYYRALLKQIVSSDGGYTFTQLQSIGFPTSQGGARKARDMVGTASLEDCIEYVLAYINQFKQAAEDMSDGE